MPTEYRITQGRWRHGRNAPNFLLLTRRVRTAQRPPDPGRQRLAQIRPRLRAVRRYHELVAAGASRPTKQVCAEFNLKRTTLLHWVAVCERNGPEALANRSHRPEHSPACHPWWLEDLVLTVRLRTGWGSQRIAEELDRRGVLRLSHESIERILERRAMPIYEPARRTSRVRYERDEPNDLWHLDLKGPFYIKGVGRFYFVGLIDDHSRFLVRATLIEAKEQDRVLAVIQAALEEWGAPREMMTDNGTEFTNRRDEDPSPLEEFLGEKKVRYMRTSVAQPETNGKIERFWKTLIVELLETQFFQSLEEAQAALDRFVEEYNFHRLHSAINYSTPASRYLGCTGYDNGFAGVYALSGLDEYLAEVRQAAQTCR